MLFGAVEVVTFFYFSNKLTRKWVNYSEKKFSNEIFQTALILRIGWVIASYLLYLQMTGKPFEFSPGDALFYNNIGQFGADLISRANFNFYSEFDKYSGGLAVSDAGYPVYISFVYFLTGKSIIILRLFKALWGAWTCLLIYKLSKRNFGEEIGRMAAIFCMLMPNLIYYCGLHLKEVEMLFLAVAFVERTDFLIRSKKYTLSNTILPLLLVISLFFFRTALGATALFALFTAIVFSSNRILGLGKKMILIIWALIAVGFFAGGKVSTEIEELWAAKNTNQQTSMQWRAQRADGNKFAAKASKSVFAPMIFVIPFPTIVDTPGQENQQLLNGGNYVKNILAFFVMFAIFMVVKEDKWREYLLIGAFTIGYLGVIALSAFGQSERFHQPALPFLMIMAAYGVSQVTNMHKKYFTWWMVFLFIAIVAWSWFKLAGRGMA